MSSAVKHEDTITVKEAADLMHKDCEFIRAGLRNERFRFGYAVLSEGNKRWSYYINRKLFFEQTGIEERVMQ